MPSRSKEGSRGPSWMQGQGRCPGEQAGPIVPPAGHWQGVKSVPRLPDALGLPAGCATKVPRLILRECRLHQGCHPAWALPPPHQARLVGLRHPASAAGSPGPWSPGPPWAAFHHDAGAGIPAPPRLPPRPPSPPAPAGQEAWARHHLPAPVTAVRRPWPRTQSISRPSSPGPAARWLAGPKQVIYLGFVSNTHLMVLFGWWGSPHGLDFPSPGPLTPEGLGRWMFILSLFPTQEFSNSAAGLGWLRTECLFLRISFLPRPPCVRAGWPRIMFSRERSGFPIKSFVSARWSNHPSSRTRLPRDQPQPHRVERHPYQAGPQNLRCPGRTRGPGVSCLPEGRHRADTSCLGSGRAGRPRGLQGRSTSFSTYCAQLMSRPNWVLTAPLADRA